MRFFGILGVVCLALPAAQAAAATIAAYSATAYGAFNLVSAQSALTGEDVSAYLAPTLYDDTVSYTAGSADPNRHYTSRVHTGPVTGGHGGAVSGAVDTPGSAASYFATYLVYEFAYLDALYCEYGDPGSPYCPEDDLGAFTLTFDYYLESSALITLLGGPGSVAALASASVEMSLCGETLTVFSSAFAETSESDFDTLSGTCSIVLQRGSSAYVDITVLPVDGAADRVEVTSMPLPTALPLLAAGLGAFGLVGQRRAGIAGLPSGPVRASSA